MIFGQNAIEYQSSWESYKDKARPLKCPICGENCPYHFHGVYVRHIFDVEIGDPHIKILRYKSSRHGETVSVLPEFLTPRKRYSLPVISLVLYLSFFLGWDLRRVHKTLGEASYSAILGWCRDWRLNTVNLLQMGLPAMGITEALSSPRCLAGDFAGAAFSACVRHTEESGAEPPIREEVDMERISKFGRNVLPRAQLSLSRSFPQLWLFRERVA